MATAEQTAERIMKLINSSPRSPRKDEIMAVLQGDQEANLVREVAGIPGAYVCISPDGTLRFEGWRVTYNVPVLIDQNAQRAACLAIIGWLRDKVVIDLKEPMS